jgi:S-adenosylmethionine-dependent methyltransferase
LFKGQGEEFLQFYDNTPGGRLYVKCCRRRIAEHIPLGRNIRILDVGAGIGRITIPFAADGHHLTLYDRDASMLEFALGLLKEHGLESKASTVQGEMSLLKHFESNIFDLVVCFSALEHCEFPNLAISEMVRVSKPGGRIICTASNYTARLKSAMKRRDPEAAQRVMQQGVFEDRESEKPCLVWGFRADELWGYFTAAGAKVEWIKGERILKMLLGDDELDNLVDSWGLDKCLDLELNLAEDPSLAGAGEYYCLSAVKP